MNPSFSWRSHSWKRTLTALLVTVCLLAFAYNMNFSIINILQDMHTYKNAVLLLMNMGGGFLCLLLLCRRKDRLLGLHCLARAARYTGREIRI